MERRRPALVLGLFGVAVVAGAAAFALTQPKPPASPFASIDARVAEPQPAANLAHALVRNDPAALADAANPDLLTSLGGALDPIATVTDIRYVGGVERAGVTYAGYVATGKDERGNQVIVGFVLHVLGNTVASVN